MLRITITYLTGPTKYKAINSKPVEARSFVQFWIHCFRIACFLVHLITLLSVL